MFRRLFPGVSRPDLQFKFTFANLLSNDNKVDPERFYKSELISLYEQVAVWSWKNF